jgi:ParB-like chromosome segregation protein Spo0J
MKQITNISTNVLKVHPKNQEFFDDIEGNQYEKFKNSIQVDGVITPLIISHDMTIISGHQRYKACIELGMKLVPVIIDEDLIDENDKLRKLLAANFGRLKNDEVKQRKVAVKYVELCGIKRGGNHKSNNSLLTLDEIANQLGTSQTTLKEMLAIERKLIPEIKILVDKMLITKTTASKIWVKLSLTEQSQLFEKLGEDNIAEMTQKQTQQYIENNGNTAIPSKNKRRKLIPQTTIKHLINRTNGQCEICNWGGIGLEGILIPHHIQRYADTEDNSIDNLILICPNCHNTIHTLENCKDDKIVHIIKDNIDTKIINKIDFYVDKLK